MKTQKTIALFLTISLLSGMTAVGCSSTTQNSSGTSSENSPSGNVGDVAQGKEDFVIGISSDLKSLDPHATNDSVSSMIQYHLYSTLVTVDESGEISGDLAESWEYLSDTELKIKLRQGVKFHDGTELKANDVKFSLEREKEGARTAYLVESMQDITVDSDYELTIHLKATDSSFLYSLAQAGSSILPEKALTEQGDAFFDHPIGTGPLQYSEWVPNDHITLSRYEEYYNGSPAAASITWRISATRSCTKPSWLKDKIRH